MSEGKLFSFRNCKIYLWLQPDQQSHALGPQSPRLWSLVFTELCSGENPSTSPEGCIGNSVLKSAVVTGALHIIWWPLFVDLREEFIFNFGIKKSASFERFLGDTIVWPIRFFFLHLLLKKPPAKFKPTHSKTQGFMVWIFVTASFLLPVYVPNSVFAFSPTSNACYLLVVYIPFLFKKSNFKSFEGTRWEINIFFHIYIKLLC